MNAGSSPGHVRDDDVILLAIIKFVELCTWSYGGASVSHTVITVAVRLTWKMVVPKWCVYCCYHVVELTDDVRYMIGPGELVQAPCREAWRMVCHYSDNSSDRHRGADTSLPDHSRRLQTRQYSSHWLVSNPHRCCSVSSWYFQLHTQQSASSSVMSLYHSHLTCSNWYRYSVLAASSALCSQIL